MGIDADPGGHREIASHRMSSEILILNSSQGEAANLAIHQRLRGPARPQGDANVVGQRIGRAERKNGKRNGSAGKSLNDVMDSAIASTGEDCVAAPRHRESRVDSRFLARAAHGKLGMNARRRMMPMAWSSSSVAPLFPAA